MIFFFSIEKKIKRMTDCAICYCPIEGPKVRCTEPDCTAAVCTNCLTRYIKIVAEDNSDLGCPSEKCMGEYDDVSIDSLAIDVKFKYRRWLVSNFGKKKTGEITTVRKGHEAIETIRSDRARFYRENMPKAILKVAELAFANRLKKVQKAIVNKNVKEYMRPCINLFCKGFLDKNMICLKCTTSFCKECEEPTNAGGAAASHVCKKETSESLAYIKSLTACPNCHTKIEKGEGCMAITCAICNTNFWYNSGERGKSGNHDHRKVEVRTTYKLTIEHAELFEKHNLIDKIRLLEQNYNKPPPVSEASLIGFASRSAVFGDGERPTQSADAELVKFSRRYSDFIRHRATTVSIGKRLVTIEKVINDGGDDVVQKIRNVLPDSRHVMISKMLKNDDVVT